MPTTATPARAPQEPTTAAVASAEVATVAPAEPLAGAELA
jgi:hypothetical protein